MKRIFEYEFNAEKNGKKVVVQQSGFNQSDAKKRIKTKEKDIIIKSFKTKFSYPHTEGGKKI